MDLKSNSPGFRSAKGGWASCGSDRPFLAILFAFALMGAPHCVWAQLSPSEILNPRSKTLEKDHLSQLISFNHAIQSLQFPFPFLLRRYVGLSPRQDPSPDTRGLQFLMFHKQTILKISGDYEAAFNGDTLTRNQRAARAFEDVAVAILRILPQEIPATVACDGVGFEISYHVRSRDRSFDYEGAENLVVILGKNDAFAFSGLPGKQEWQDVLNRSQVYIDQKEFGLALGERDPYPLESLDKSSQGASIESPGTAVETAAGPAKSDDRLARVSQHPVLEPRISVPDAQDTKSPALSAAGTGSGTGQLVPQAASPPAATQSDVQRLQTRYQAQLDALGKEGAEKMHFVAYAPPSLVLFQNRLYLQITLRNPRVFDAQTSSIYRRAAQSFDLFLAPQLKPLLAQVPSDPSLAGLDITVLNELGSEPKPSSEAAEFICPLAPLRQFADAEITNQDLINQSIILVNGVRIALNLQQVE
jgi:hypothetical protein